MKARGLDTHVILRRAQRVQNVIPRRVGGSSAREAFSYLSRGDFCIRNNGAVSVCHCADDPAEALRVGRRRSGKHAQKDQTKQDPTSHNQSPVRRDKPAGWIEWKVQKLKV